MIKINKLEAFERQRYIKKHIWLALLSYANISVCSILYISNFLRRDPSALRHFLNESLKHQNLVFAVNVVCSVNGNINKEINRQYIAVETRKMPRTRL